jgi:predicted RNA-binding protein with PIN domain
MPPAALDAARRVIEDDDGFRARVAEAASAETVGEAGWLWLARPVGWDEVLAARKAAVATDAAEREAAQTDQQMSRRLAAATEAAARSEALRLEAERQLTHQRDQLAESRRQRRELQVALDEARTEATRLTEERMVAVRQLKAAEAQLADRGAEARELRREVHELRGEVEELRARLAAAEGDVDGGADGVGTAGRERGDGGTGPVAEPPVDRAGLARAVAAASAAAAQLSRALGSASSFLDLPASEADRPPAGRRGAGSRNGRPGMGGGPPRRPLRMPPGVFDDTGEAVDFLCRAARVLFLVDGYNVSKTAWADHDLANQRQRLVDGLVNLHAKTGAQVEVVFDGVDDGSLGARVMPGPVRVRFTPAGLEADDMILELLDAHLADQPIVVVSSDKRVRDGARKRGANTLSSDLFVPVLR